MMFGQALYTHYFIDHFIAPEMSTLTECKMDDLEDWAENLPAFILNYNFVIKAPENHKTYALNYIRRVDEAARQYQVGKAELHRFIPRRNTASGAYFAVLHLFEQCISLAWQARCMWDGLVGTTEGGRESLIEYKPNDNSVEDNIRKIYNAIKHTDKRIRNGLLPENGTVPVWITNAGIKSTRNHVSFVQLHEFLTKHIRFARTLAIDLPRHWVEQRQSASGPGESTT